MMMMGADERELEDLKRRVAKLERRVTTLCRRSVFGSHLSFIKSFSDITAGLRWCIWLRIRRLQTDWPRLLSDLSGNPHQGGVGVFRVGGVATSSGGTPPREQPRHSR
jgi:hypothetical protein